VFARRASWEGAASPLAGRVEERRRRGLPVLDLGETNPTRLGLDAPGVALARALAEVAADPATRRYAADPRGDGLAREAVAALCAAHGAAVAAEHVILTAGTSEGYTHLFRLLGDPGDRVHLPSPGYGLFEHLAGLEGLEAAPYRLLPPARGARWRVDRDALAAALDARSRALLAIHPHNPTGSLLDADDLASLRALAAERDLALLSDEVFAETAAPGAFRTALDGAGEGALHVVLSGASKLLGLPQLKVAWLVVAGPPALRDDALARLEVIADAHLSVSPLLARALARLLPQREALMQPLRARVAANRARLAALGTATGLVALPAEAGWSALLRLRVAEPGLDDEDVALRLLERTGVLAQPGALFDLAPVPGAAHLVVSLLPEPERFALGLDALAGFAATLA
jgi:aspartate/methionine/tyrosine aminotransferase